MDKVKVVTRVEPLVSRIVDLKMEVWRHHIRLDWGKICTDHLGGRILVG